MKIVDSLDIVRSINILGKNYKYLDLNEAASKLGFDLNKLPYSMRVLFENTLRNEDGKNNDIKSLKHYLDWSKNKKSTDEVGFMPARVLMQDFTGVPAVVDLAAMRDAMNSLGGDPKKINPMIPVDLVIDHSIQVDSYASDKSLIENTKLEITRNIQRYEFLKWGQKAFDNFRVVPFGTGICHQVNIEYLATVVCEKDGILYPDSVIGTDSHTTMINGLGVLGWGVGGIEAEAAMLGQISPMILPDVIGVKLEGYLKEGVTATDLVLTLTQMLRKYGVVNKFVEYFGPGLKNLNLANRATIANMAPEYGATCGFFPVDEETIKYLHLTGRDEKHIQLVEEYCKKQNLWLGSKDPEYTDVLILDLSTVEPCLAGPKRPQDKVILSDVPLEFKKFQETIDSGNGAESGIQNGDVVIAAITSCTNTSNPYVLVAAALVAKKAVELGLHTKPWVKTSLAPGSKVVTEYLEQSGLQKYLDKLGFNLVGYGCTTCIGNSGPLKQDIEKQITDNKLLAVSVLSGNRNFEGRVHPLVKANYLASPPLVVVYAIAGNINVNLYKDPLCEVNGKKIYIKDLWPTESEINDILEKNLSRKMFTEKYNNLFEGDEDWKLIKTTNSDTYSWDKNNSYINNPPYFENLAKHSDLSIKDAKILAIFGDSITTDHISPAGNISKTSPAAKYLQSLGIDVKDFNSYGARRGNHEVMMRGTFANIRIKNEMCQGVEGGVTKYNGIGENISIFDAAEKYKNSETQTIIVSGKEYGTGSSRDWAAKGPKLLGVRAIIAESFERIHRANLVGMGIIPMIFTDNQTRLELNLDGTESVTIEGLDSIAPYKLVEACFKSSSYEKRVTLKLQIFTEIEVQYIKNGGILNTVVQKVKNNN
jgi:aconitate hydratase